MVTFAARVAAWGASRGAPCAMRSTVARWKPAREPRDERRARGRAGAGRKRPQRQRNGKGQRERGAPAAPALSRARAFELPAALLQELPRAALVLREVREQHDEQAAEGGGARLANALHHALHAPLAEDHLHHLGVLRHEARHAAPRRAMGVHTNRHTTRHVRPAKDS